MDDEKHYELLVMQDEHGNLYFFGHSILWCLGYERPHIALNLLVPENERYQFHVGRGKFLNESTIQRLITERKQNSPDPKHVIFENWFTDYIKNCKGTNPSTLCPY